ncbi:MerR family transcriptional regulator [Limosilactobacillus sp. RRLNB_1_1]|uniref:MerR family transcriptional regulator n=1 Tax=Limosilactobacillus albertensis TaxID=2759752 RepID=A0A7W3TQ89_9LACO|nr:MerR family transcriptional regulator [Limosilactobacillus albertensis]MBB1068899.1 MerR family transcriptional regulator [Limosilactobacillus albertensis]MCD7118659.1 MerR family transcriptional regulator [Limosilactobacillus albertensis]MCD7128192.1 MerR family transcriptional regulator [Limosilactobacillus albertensis]
MLKTMEFAKLVGTTRRTLIFYDEKDIFKPVTVSPAGYRYYDYDQIYSFEMINSLREAGLSLEQIKRISNETNKQKQGTELRNSLVKLQQKILTLQASTQALKRRISNLRYDIYSSPKNVPVIITCLEERYWCSDNIDQCDSRIMAIHYSTFIKKLRLNQVITADNGGFLTNLPLSDYVDYPTSQFRFIQADYNPISKPTLPTLIKPAGRYLAIKTGRRDEEIMIGLQILKDYVQTHRLNIANYLWQFNTSMDVNQLGSSPEELLQYQIF